MNKLIRFCLPIVMLVVWLLPVSNQYNTLNPIMVKNCYILNLLVIAFIFLYENKYCKKSMLCSVGIMLCLLIFTVIYHSINKNSTISYGYLLNYVSYCLLINIRFNKIKGNKIWDMLFLVVCWGIITIGILTVVGNGTVEDLLKTYYINHYAHVYIVMWEARKTVTFFATHSIASYIYFMLWLLLDYRNSVRRSTQNYVLMGSMIFLITMCKSFSAVMCIFIIAGVYYFKWIKQTSIKSIFKLICGFAAGIILIAVSFNHISRIFSSDVNGLLGRFGSNGNVIIALKQALEVLIPLGISDVDNMWLTDGGYFINFIRGGIPLVLFYYIGLYIFIKRNIKHQYIKNILFISLMLFEIGYQYTMSMRFFMIMVYFVVYYQYLYSLKINGLERSNNG